MFPTELRLFNCHENEISAEGVFQVQSNWHESDGWGTVCSPYITFDTAEHLCKLLGHITVLRVLKGFPTMESLYPVHLEIGDCVSGDTSLEAAQIPGCVTSNWGGATCDHSANIAIVCLSSKNLPCIRSQHCENQNFL